MEPYLGEIRPFPFNFAPLGWADCDGRLLSISDNDALYSLLGTTYGGDGISTFGLPDLRGRRTIHQGSAPGLSTHAIGESAGVEQVTLTSGQLPFHNHPAACFKDDANQGTPGNSFPAPVANGYAPASSANMAPGMIGNTGSGAPFPIDRPFLVIRYCIAVEGIYPSRS